MNRHARALFLLISTALLASSFAWAPATQAAPTDDKHSRTEARVPRTSTTAVAAGIILETKDGKISSGLRTRAESLTDGAVKASRPVLDDRRVLDFETPVPLADAQEIADALERRSDVVSAEPDLILTIQTTPPVPRNDALFPQQFGVWDSRSSAFGATLHTGGFSVKAPYLWKATTGKSTVRVAVIDTGMTVHPDLAGQTVPGYDFVTDRTDSEPDSARDGIPNRDSDPTDPGDWTPANFNCGDLEDEPVSDSSWHGTHVAGIVAAKANNTIGITGIASGVKVQPIRALGACGGATSDIAAAIVWASGGSVPGVPMNQTPSKIINLSLSEAGPCSGTFQVAINTARNNGSVVLAAAGNGSDEGSFAVIGSPANCVGATAVTATDELGQVTTYSSVGTDGTEFSGAPDRPANISAPGGESSYYNGIMSTVNDGATAPTTAGYAEYDGTSMAAPAVAAGAALMSSLGYTRAEIEKALKYAVRGFPQYDDIYDCNTVLCGRGILDLSKVPAPYGTTKVSGTMKKGKKLTAYSTWVGSPKLTYRWLRNGSSISGATGRTYTLKSADKGKKISVRVTGTKSGFKTLTKTSASRKVAR